MTFDEYADSQKLLFATLARKFGWTYDQMADMTQEQLFAACEPLPNEVQNTGNAAADGNLHFSTSEEWQIWRQNNG